MPGMCYYSTCHVVMYRAARVITLTSHNLNMKYGSKTDDTTAACLSLDNTIIINL